MSLRAYWTAFFTYIAFFGIMLLCAFTFGKASMSGTFGMSKDELYLMEVMTIDVWDDVPYFALMPQTDYDDLDALMAEGQPNLIVRVKIEDRLPCEVYDPFGFYDEGYLGDPNFAAYLYIATPYKVKIEEVYLGDTEMFPEGNDFTFYAPYGIIGNYGIRYEDCPFFQTGHEYILFFSLLDVTGVGLWYDLAHPSAVCEIMPEDERTFIAQTNDATRIFRETGYDVETLKTMIEDIYAKELYPTDIPSLKPQTPFATGR